MKLTAHCPAHNTLSRVVLTQLQGRQKIQAYDTPWKGGPQSYLTKKSLITITFYKHISYFLLINMWALSKLKKNVTNTLGPIFLFMFNF